MQIISNRGANWIMPLNDLRQQGTLFGVMPNVICYPAFAIFSRERHFTPVRVTLFPALAVGYTVYLTQDAKSAYVPSPAALRAAKRRYAWCKHLQRKGLACPVKQPVCVICQGCETRVRVSPLRLETLSFFRCIY